MTGTAAFVRNGRLDILSANQNGYALYARVFDDPVRPGKMARYIYLDDRSPGYYRDWDGIAQQAVGSLRAEAGRDPARPGAERPGRRAVHAEPGGHRCPIM